MTLRRLLCTIGAIGVCTSVIAFSLLARVPDVVDVPLVPSEPGLQSMPFTLFETAGPAPPVYVLWLHVDDASALVKHAEVKILFTAYGSSARTVAAALRVGETPCTYVGRRGAPLHDHALISFVRGTDCAATTARSEDLKLSMTLDRRVRFGVFSFLPSPLAHPADPAISVLGLSGQQPAAYPLLLGRYVDPGAGTIMRRVDLLNYLWQINPSTNWIWRVVASCACLALIGALLMPFSARSPDSGVPGFTPVAAIAMFCLTAALSGLYVVLVPPFQAADEPDHLLSYAQLTRNPGIEHRAAEWARLGHFQRLRFHPDERFRPADVGRPYHLAWDDTVFAEDVSTRSAVTAGWWRFLSRFLDGRRLEKRLLLMRFAHAALFASSVAVATAILTVATAGEMAYPQLLGIVFLLVPSLPFFAMQLSESSVLCSVYVLLAACVLALMTDGPRSWIVGAPLGLAMGLTLVSGRSALPMAPLLAAVLLARVILGARSETAAPYDWKGSMTFWLSFASGLVLIATLFRPQYAPSVDAVSTFGTNTLYPALRSFWQPWIFVCLSLGAFVLEFCAFVLRRAAPVQLETLFGAATRWICFGVAALVLGSLGLSLFVDFPQLQLTEVAFPPTAPRYVFDVLSVALSWARIRMPDPLLTSAFWAGFGWLDVVPSELLTDGLTIGAAVLLTILAIRTGRQRNTRRFVYLACLAGGAAATTAAYAVATYQMHRDLHGRYLIGLYITMLAVTFSSVASARSWRTPISSAARPTVLLCLAGGIHCYCLWFILGRYF